MTSDLQMMIMINYTNVTTYDIILSMSAHYEYVALYNVTASYTKLQ